MDIDELREQHQGLAVIASQLKRAVSDESTTRSVGALRWQFARQLMAHLALEDHIFYPEMHRATDEAARALALRIQGEVGGLAADFAAYMTRWNDDRVAREWRNFCYDTREILNALGIRVRKEEELLYPLAEKRARVAVAAAAH